MCRTVRVCACIICVLIFISVSAGCSIGVTAADDMVKMTDAGPEADTESVSVNETDVTVVDIVLTEYAGTEPYTIEEYKTEEYKAEEDMSEECRPEENTTFTDIAEAETDYAYDVETENLISVKDEQLTEVPECEMSEEEILSAFMDGFNSARLDKGLSVITEKALIEGMMRGSKEWAIHMAEEKVLSHSDYSWMKPFRVWEEGYTTIIEGIDVINDGCTYDNIYYAGRMMCAHVGADYTEVDIKYMGVGVCKGWHTASNYAGSDANGNPAIYVCVGTIVKH